MPIKTKIVLAMCGLSVGVSLLIFAIVMIIATSSLESTIEQAGVGMLQQAEAIHRPYKAGLNEKGLIAYFSQPSNRDKKFGDYWQKIQDQWFSKTIPGCREFANWEQFKDDRVWVKCAAEVQSKEGASGLNDAQGYEIFGESWKDLRDLGPGGKLIEPQSPRRINESAMERVKHLFPNLFQRYKLDASRDSFARLKAKINEETDQSLIHHQAGLRKKIFSEFQKEFVADLD
ncbi:MAG: hypothetical protein KDB32_08955, partial [Planctomycetes bacterium]|nr:hypothetical protein [Planctomycetota bacterium]